MCLTGQTLARCWNYRGGSGRHASLAEFLSSNGFASVDTPRAISLEDPASEVVYPIHGAAAPMVFICFFFLFLLFFMCSNG